MATISHSHLSAVSSGGRRGILLVGVLCSLTFGEPTGAAERKPSSACCGYTLVGSLWYDENANGIKESGEPPLAGWTVQVFNASSTLVGSTVTNAAGAYAFDTPVACGTTFTLKQVVQPGWNQTFPIAGSHHSGTGVGCGDTLGVYDFGNVDNGCMGLTKTYTLDADFTSGVLSGVVTNSDQLELSPTTTTWPYAWIANSGEGTISKVDTETGKEVGRYYTGPPNGAGVHDYLSPSRTVVDKDGNCWVANRTTGDYPSVTQIVTTGGDDRNLNSLIDTSNDVDGDGVINSGEILAWGLDERVKRHYLLGSTITNPARGILIDQAGFLWVGLSTSTDVLKIDPELPIATYAPNLPAAFAPSLASVHTGKVPYGLALAPNGLIYMSTHYYWAFEIDPGLASGGTAAGPAVTDSIQHTPYGNYGIAVDKDCNVWLSVATHQVCLRWDTLADTWTVSGLGAPDLGRGITVDFDNNVWMSCTGTSTVVRYNNTPSPTVYAVYSTPVSGAIGVGVASDGNLIVTAGGPLWCKVNTTSGAVMPLPGPTLAGVEPYTYSDFTGSLYAMSALQQGTWTVITDGGSPNIVWTLVGWTPSTPPGTSVQIEARAAQTLPVLAGTAWTTIGTSGPLGSPMPGRYIETRARLQRTIGGCSPVFVTPILYDLTVEAICDSCQFVSCAPDTVIPCENGQGAAFQYTSPLLESTCDSTYQVTCVPPSGSVFPIGTTPVVCTAVNAYGDTVVCQFSVTVLEGCDPTPTGACCIQNDCEVLTEHDCQIQGGIYFGDGSDCSVGCDYDCISPPHKMLGWWPFDTATGGKTPNLAHPRLRGTLIGNPTALQNEHVNGSYAFNGSSQYVEVMDSPVFAIGTGDFSIDAWVKTDATGIRPILDKRAGVATQGFGFYLNDGYPALQLAVGGVVADYVLDAKNAGQGAFVGDGQWHLVAVTVDRGDPDGVLFYVDGNVVGSPFDPTGQSGSLDNGAPLWVARSHPHPTSRYFLGALDELEMIQHKLSADKIAAIHAAGAAGKCPEECYATQHVPCCQGFTTMSTVAICNYDVVSHVYSFGLSPIGGGAGCGPVGPLSYTPATGTITVGPGVCVNVPITIGCPTSIPVGQIACYQVSIFNHDTGRLFACTGSVRITKKWCVAWQLPHPVGIVPIDEGQSRPFTIEIGNVADETTPSTLNYTVRALNGGCCEADAPSTAVELNGLPPGDPVTGSLMVGPGQRRTVSIDVELPIAWRIGYERVAVYGDDDGDSVDEKIGEIAVRALPASLVDVPSDPSGEAAELPARMFVTVPNPFGVTGEIRFRVSGPGSESVNLRLYDLNGRTVKVFHMYRTLAPGEHTVPWNSVDERGRRLGAGMYFLKLEVGKRAETVKLVLRR